MRLLRRSVMGGPSLHICALISSMSWGSLTRRSRRSRRCSRQRKQRPRCSQPRPHLNNRWPDSGVLSPGGLSPNYSVLTQRQLPVKRLSYRSKRSFSLSSRLPYAVRRTTISISKDMVKHHIQIQGARHVAQLNTVANMRQRRQNACTTKNFPGMKNCHGVVPPGRDEGYIGPPRPTLIYDTDSMALSH